MHRAAVRYGVGAGLPTAVNTHDVAGRVARGAKVGYVDNDPVVLAHAQALLATAPGVIALPGDVRDPAVILADPQLAKLIGLDEPVCVLLSGVLHFLDATTARQVELVPPGLVPVRGWEGGGSAPDLEPRRGTFLAGVGGKQR